MKHLKDSMWNFCTVVFALCIFLVGCSDLYNLGTPPLPTPEHIYNYAGTWTGSLSEQASDARSASINITILEHDFRESVDTSNWLSSHYGTQYNLKGSWLAEFSSELSAIGIFEAGASAYSPDFRAQLIFGDDTNCSISVNATRVGDTITGTYQPYEYNYPNCDFSGIKVGIFDIGKQ